MKVTITGASQRFVEAILKAHRQGENSVIQLENEPPLVQEKQGGSVFTWKQGDELAPTTSITTNTSETRESYWHTGTETGTAHIIKKPSPSKMTWCGVVLGPADVIDEGAYFRICPNCISRRAIAHKVTS